MKRALSFNTSLPPTLEKGDFMEKIIGKSPLTPPESGLTRVVDSTLPKRGTPAYIYRKKILIKLSY
jgi:hypothetical protein